MVNRIFAESLRQEIHGMVNPRHLLYPGRILKERVLDDRCLDKAGEHHPCLTVGDRRIKELVKALLERLEELGRIGRGPAQPQFNAPVFEILCSQKNNEPRCGQFVAPRLDAGGLEVLRKLCKDERRVVRGRGEGLGLADGLIAAL